jgi:hypothetical protein
MKTSVVFSSTFVKSNFPHNRGPGSGPSSYPESEQRRVGYLAVIEPGGTVPVTISWREPAGRVAARVDYGRGSLPLQ